MTVSLDSDRSIGVGMSPGDGAYDEPYWYVTPYPIPDGVSLAPLGGGGHWHTEGWTGAVLNASSLESDGAQQARQLAEFLQSAFDASEALLAPRT